MKILGIQLATPGQISEIVALDRLCFGGLWTAEGYQREIESSQSDLLVLLLVDQKQERQGVWEIGRLGDREKKSQPNNQLSTIIGLGCLWAIVDEAHITLLGIHPEYQGQGFGKLLLCNLLHKAVARQLTRATLEVAAGNHQAISLYEKFGFRLAGRRRNYYPQTGEDALILWLKGLEQPEFSQELAHRQQKILNSLQGTPYQYSATNH